MTDPESSDDDGASSSCATSSSNNNSDDSRSNEASQPAISRKRPRPWKSNNLMVTGEEEESDGNDDDLERNHIIINKPYLIEWPTDADDDEEEVSDDDSDGHDNNNNKLNAIVTFYTSSVAVAVAVAVAKEPPTAANDRVDRDFGKWKHDKLCLMGRAQISCLEGSITILGYRLDSTTSVCKGREAVEKIQIESPPWSSLLVLEPDQIPTSTRNSNTSMPDETVTAAPRQKLAVIRVESWWPNHQAVKPTPTEGKDEKEENPRHSCASSSSSGPTFEFVECKGPSVRPTYVPSMWKNVLDQALPELYSNTDDGDSKTKATKETKNVEPKECGHGKNKTTTTTNNNTNIKSFRMAICGAKGVGKSTFLRYATNRILSHPSGDIGSSSNTRRVCAILDADVGQPEMSPPGMVTLTIIYNPLLTPPHYRSMAMTMSAAADGDDISSSSSCQQKQKQQQHHHDHHHYQQYSYFFGGVTSKQDPNRYLQFLKRLIRQYEELCAGIHNNHNKDNKDKNNRHHSRSLKIPLLINLDGWVKGLGYELLTTILTEILDPSHVVQIVGTTRSKQFPLREILNPQVSRARLHVVHSYNSSLNFPSSLAIATERNENNCVNNNAVPQQQLQDRPTTTTASTTSPLSKVPVSCTMPAQHLRTIRLCTYFLNDVTIWYDLGFNHEGIRDDTCEIAHRLSGALPYAVPFEAVEIQWEGSDHFADLLVEEEDNNNLYDNERENSNFDLILDALNAKIVGLCCRCGTGEVDGDDSDDDEALVSCVGLGLVRAIDRVQRIFYILTPVHPKKLQQVNVLVGGMLEVPLEFWFRGVHAEAFPYQSFVPPGNASIGSDPMKSRNNIGRKSLIKSLINGANAPC